jgi:hypothetical protein
MLDYWHFLECKHEGISMKSILLASVATVALAGAAAAEITWSGTGSVSIGRTGSVAEVKAAVTNKQIAAALATLNGITTGVNATAYAALTATASTTSLGSSNISTALTAAQTAILNSWYGKLTAAQVAQLVTDLSLASADWTAIEETAYIVARAAFDDLLASIAGWEDSTVAGGTTGIAKINSAIDIDDAFRGTTTTDITALPSGVTSLDDVRTYIIAISDAVNETRRVDLLNEGSAAKAAGATKMTTAGTLTASMTVGDDYVASLSFNAGTGAFGALSLAHPDMGTLTFSPNAIAATVDASDKGGDLKYTNTVGGWAVAMTLDIDADTAQPGRAGDARNGVSAKASDSQWSVSASGTLTEGTTASIAFDQEGGYAMGVATSFAGIDLDLGTSMTAAAGTVNTLGIGYTMGDISLGWDYSDADADNTYTLSLGYSMDGTTVSFAYQENADYDISVATSVAGVAVTLATDESAAWSLGASMPIGTAGTLTASTNSAEAMSLTAAFKF